jgi:hypothetical protein
MNPDLSHVKAQKTDRKKLNDPTHRVGAAGLPE